MSDFDKKKYDNDYIKNHYRSILLRIPFDDAETLDNHVKDIGEKRMAFIKRAIKETIEDETGATFEEATKS